MHKLLIAAALLATDGPQAVPVTRQALEPPVVRFQGLAKSGAAVFEVANPNGRPLPFRGYVMAKEGIGVRDGRISPLYATGLRRGGAWQESGGGWCGTGVGPVAIPARATVAFEAFILPGDFDEVKIGLRWYSTGDRTGPAAIAWSNRVLRQQVEKKGP